MQIFLLVVAFGFLRLVMVQALAPALLPNFLVCYIDTFHLI